MNGTQFDILDAEAKDRTRRRSERLGTLAVARAAMGLTVGWLGDGAAGRLPEAEQDRFDARGADPFLAMSRVSHELCRLVMLEERLDEDAETREKRIAEEQAERERKARAEVEALKRDAEAAVFQEKKRVAREATGRIYLEAFPKTTEMDLNRLLDELLDGYELDLDDDLERAYGDVTAAVVRLCEELKVTAVKDDGGADKTPEQTRERLIALVEDVIDTVTEAYEAGDEPVPALAQGPPG